MKNLIPLALLAVSACAAHPGTSECGTDLATLEAGEYWCDDEMLHLAAPDPILFRACELAANLESVNGQPLAYCLRGECEPGTACLALGWRHVGAEHGPGLFAVQTNHPIPELQELIRSYWESK